MYNSFYFQLPLAPIQAVQEGPPAPQGPLPGPPQPPPPPAQAQEDPQPPPPPRYTIDIYVTFNGPIMPSIYEAGRRGRGRGRGSGRGRGGCG